MIHDELYDLAFLFRKTALWKKLYDSQLFAVKHSDGSIGYCCVMGTMGEHLALAVYPGSEALDTYRLMGQDRTGMSAFEAHEIMLSQDCVMVSFVNKSDLMPAEAQQASAYCAARGITAKGKRAYPQFERYRPRYVPWRVDDKADQRRLLEAMRAAVAVSEKLTCIMPETVGFTDGAPYDRAIPLLEMVNGAFVWGQTELPAPGEVRYPSPEIVDEIALKNLAKSKGRGVEWACDMFMHVNPVSDEADWDDSDAQPKCAPHFPYVLLIVNNQSGMVLSVQIGGDDYSEHFARAVLNLALDSGRPSRIVVSNPRTYALLSKLAKQIGVELIMKDRIPLLEEAEQGLLESAADGGGDSEDEMAMLMDMLKDPKAYQSLPDDILDLLSQMAGKGILPPDIAANLARERKLRGKR